MKTLRIVLLAALAALLASCGGGTGGTGVTSTPPSNAVSLGVMTKGSVIVNGVHFDDNAATIKIDDTPKTPNDLQSGMVVRLRGQINSDNTTGTAQVVNVSTEVRGTVQTHNAAVVPATFTVVGQTVFVDDLTILVNFGASPTPAGAVGQLVNGSSFVEVHGLRNASGAIQASRVELLTPVAGNDELRGTVTALTASTFTLQNGTTNVSVSFSGGTTITPSPAALVPSAIVEVHGTFNGATFAATLINVEDDAQFQHQAGEEFEVEGLVSGCGATNPCVSFNVGSQAVQVNASTRFEGGLATDLADGVQVEAEGHQFTGSTLIAEKIEFKRSVIRLQGTTANATANSFDMQIANGTITVTIVVDSQTTGAIPANGTCIQVRGQRKLPATPVVVLAGEIDTGCSGGGGGGGNRSIIQAPVETENGTTLTLLGFPIVVAPTDIPGFHDVNGLPITADQFFTAVTPASTDSNGVSHAGTLVKITFDAGATTVHEAELEDD